jgi:predicted HicB family RNase H-like nuclease
MNKRIDSYIKKKPLKKQFNLRMNADLLKVADVKRKKDKLSWANLVQALLEMYVEDFKK